MENRSWSFGVSTSSSSSAKFNNNYSDTNNYNNQSRYGDEDYFVDYEDIEGEEEIEADYPCPFCSEDFDIVGLCCHIEEEHYDEAKKGVCPMCGAGVGADLVEHIALQHENMYKSRNKNRHNDGESQYTLALLRKELLERSLKSFLGSSSPVVSFSNAAVDELLSSFICSYSRPAEAESEPSSSSVDAPVKEEIDEKMLERSMENCSILDEKQEEQAQKCKFVQSLLLSTLLDGGL